jgi:hypothetical protein
MSTLSAGLRQAIGKTVLLVEQGDLLYATDDPDVWHKPIGVPRESGWFMVLRQRKDGWWWIVKIAHTEEEH